MRKTELVSQIRKLQGISQSGLAKCSGVVQSSIARWEIGIPAIAEGYISKVCEILLIDKGFLAGESDYPFKPGSFIKFYIKGLSYRLRPLVWLDMLLRYAKKIEVLLLVKGERGNVVAACVKDDKGSVFLIFIEVPLKQLEVFDYIEEHHNKERKDNIVTKDFFDVIPEVFLNNLPDQVLLFQKPSSYLKDLSKEEIENMIDKAFADILSEEERELIKLIRKKEMPFSCLEDLSKKDKDIEDVLNKAITDILSAEEKKLIELIRKKKIPIEPLFVFLSHSFPESFREAIKK